eukprot:FR737253.1.p4 GENE.FR737253.1~~FR737253.1.p4  ORF type:complete len:101 (+),score=54.10 FR737253.1:847-1149(+)
MWGSSGLAVEPPGGLLCGLVRPCWAVGGEVLGDLVNLNPLHRGQSQKKKKKKKKSGPPGGESPRAQNPRGIPPNFLKTGRPPPGGKPPTFFCSPFLGEGV